jgi:hypothetical protein
MPPANQGSRGALITAVVIFAVLFVTTTIFAIYYGTRASKAEKDLEDERAKIQPEIIANLGDARLNELRNVRSGGGLPTVGARTPLLDVALAHRDALAQLLAGPDATSAAVAQEQAAAALRAARESGVQVAEGDVVAAVTTLTDALKAARDQVARLQNDLKTEQDRTKALAAANAAELKAKDEQIVQIRAQAEKAIADAGNATNESRATVQQIEQARADERAKIQAAIDQQTTQITGLNDRITQLEKELANARERLAKYRVDPSEGQMVQTDGQIISIPGNGLVYINLGSGQQVVPGLTFEVYDKAEGMPRKTETDAQGDPVLPKGKAAIEVVRVGGTSSEARIIRQETGTILTQGDLIANLVYDRNTKYNFVVYGKFDLDQNEQPTTADAEVIKRLITQWGGQIQPEVTVSTDFVVLGVEPVLPEFTADDLLDVVNVAKLDAAQRELDAYLDVVQKARDLNIPVLNQNRFLYFVGYYDLARR